MNKQAQIRELFDSLSHQKQDALLKELYATHKSGDQSKSKSRAAGCPHCQSAVIIKYGHWKQTQRYKCNTCHKTFTGTTNTRMYHLKKPQKFEAYERLMVEQYHPLNEIAKKVKVSNKTAFDWRHKILSGLKKKDTEFDGITEIDDLWVLYSQKGRKGLKYSRKRGGSKRQGDNNFQTKLLVTADRKSHIDMSVVRIGRLKRSDIENSIGNKLLPDCTLVSDKHRSISSFAKAHKLSHVSFKSREHSAGGAYHIQKVNNVASRFKSLIDYQLRGVSTKYLQSYANWFAFKERYKKKGDLTSMLDKEINSSIPDSWHVFTNIEQLYKQFIENFSVRTYRCPTRRQWKTSHIKPEIMNRLAYI